MKKKLMRAMATLWSIVLVALFSAVTAFAASPSGFGSRAVLPDNQIEGSSGYFDLMMAPGAEQTIQIEVSNSEDKDIFINVELNTAYTSQNGLVSYTEEVEKDESMEFSIADIAKPSEAQKRVAPGKTEHFDINIKMPQKEFDGVLLGGIVVTAEYPEDVDTGEEDDGGPVAIENKIAQVIGIMIRENDKVVEPEFELADVEVGLTNYYPDIKVKIRNKTAAIGRDINLKAEVTEQGSDKVLFSIEKTGAEMAPQTVGDYIIPFDGQAVKPGKYTLKASIEHNGASQEWSEDFEIEGEVANSINEQAVELPKEAIVDSDKQDLPMWLIITIAAVGVLLLVLIILVVVLLVKRGGSKKTARRNREELKAEMARNRDELRRAQAANNMYPGYNGMDNMNTGYNPMDQNNYSDEMYGNPGNPYYEDAQMNRAPIQNRRIPPNGGVYNGARPGMAGPANQDAYNHMRDNGYASAPQQPNQYQPYDDYMERKSPPMPGRDNYKGGQTGYPQNQGFEDEAYYYEDDMYEQPKKPAKRKVDKGSGKNIYKA